MAVPRYRCSALLAIWITTNFTSILAQVIDKDLLLGKLTLDRDQEFLNAINDKTPGIPGRAGSDYPVLNSVPNTSFRCRDYDFAGYFADIETGCQGYRVCFPHFRNASFLCPNGTVFNQRYFVCDWWFNFDCSLAPSLYGLNLFRRPPLPILGPAPPFRTNKRQVEIKEPTAVLTSPKAVVPKIVMLHQDNKTIAEQCYCPCLNATRPV